MALESGKVSKETHILETGETARLRAMAFICGKMVTNMRVNGSTV